MDNGLVGMSINNDAHGQGAGVGATTSPRSARSSTRISPRPSIRDGGCSVRTSATGPSVDAIEQAFMNSPGHRANILNPEFNWAGTGVSVSGNGTVYLVQVFAKY